MTKQKAAFLLMGLLLILCCSGCPLPSTFAREYGALPYAYSESGGSAYQLADTSINRITNGPYSGTTLGTPLGKGPPLLFESAWSPDGKQLAIYARANSDYADYFPHVYLVEVKTGKVSADWELRNPAEHLYQEPEDAPHPNLNWSTNGESLIVLQQSGRPQNIERVYLHRLQTGKAVTTQLVSLPLRFHDPSFRGFSQIALSPDHHSLALLEHRVQDSSSATIQLQHLKLNSQAMTPLGTALSVSGFQAERPLWSPDMSQILLLYNPALSTHNASQSEAGRTRITSVKLADGKQTLVFDPDHLNLRHPKFSPDGRHLLADASRFKLSAAALGISPQQLRPKHSHPNQALSLIRLDLNSGQFEGYNNQIDLNGSYGWQGSHQFLASQNKAQSWQLWTLDQENPTSLYQRPNLHDLKWGSVLALAPDQRKLAISLYNPCCTIKNLRTGVYIWDLENQSLTRMGPEISLLVKHFPKISLHHQSQYSRVPLSSYSGKNRTP